MSRLRVADSPLRPDLRRHVLICLGCNHWQIDIRAGAISDLGGWQSALMVLAAEHYQHQLNDCVNPAGRVLFEGKWVDPPKMSDGKPANGTLAFSPVPRWWVTQ